MAMSHARNLLFMWFLNLFLQIIDEICTLMTLVDNVVIVPDRYFGFTLSPNEGSGYESMEKISTC